MKQQETAELIDEQQLVKNAYKIYSRSVVSNLGGHKLNQRNQQMIESASKKETKTGVVWKF